MTTITTLFSGGELVGTGARAAGLTHLTGIEYNNDIANVARANGFDIITADVMTIDPHTLEVPDVLHASPVCKRASGANQSAELNEDGTKEAPEDIAAGEKIAQFIDVMRPRYFTLENVYGYRNFQAFKIVCAGLDRNGYSFDYWHLNAADYGVPQSRQRLILIAKLGRGQWIQKPTPTHHDPKDYNPAQISMFEPTTKPWIGWYESILDLIPTLPESQFAAWQLARLPEGLTESLICNGTGSDDFGIVPRFANEPVGTVKSADYKGFHRAFILDCQNGAQEGGVTLRQGDAPMFTVTSGKGGRQPVRAWLVDGQNASRDLTILADNIPACTVGASGKGATRALLVSGGNSFQPVLRDDAPSVKLGASSSTNLHHRAWLSAGRVVRMNVRALARFQSVPDSYILPPSDKLACVVIGNGVPCKLYEAIIGGLTANR